MKRIKSMTHMKLAKASLVKILWERTTPAVKLVFTHICTGQARLDRPLKQGLVGSLGSVGTQEPIYVHTLNFRITMHKCVQSTTGEGKKHSVRKPPRAGYIDLTYICNKISIFSIRGLSRGACPSDCRDGSYIFMHMGNGHGPWTMDHGKHGI